MDIREQIKLVTEFVNTIKHKNIMQREIAIADKFPDFWKDYPFLAKKLAKDNQDLSMLETMLSKIDKINNGETSTAKVEYELGEQLADKYLGHLRNDPNKED